jgi:TolA-binding protein
MSQSIEDLSARARRANLGEAERRRLKLMLGASVEGRLLHRAGLDFDEENAVLPGDDAIAARIAERVLARSGRAPGVRRRRKWLPLAAAACLITAAAAGAAARYRGVIVARRTVSAPADRPPTPASDRRPSSPPLAPVSAPAAPPAITVDDPPEVDLPPPPVARRSTALANPSGNATPSAGDLFAEAARARRERNVDDAIRLFESLQRRYPASPESRAADISLGMMQLGRGAATAALDHFRRYLRHSADGELVPEALWGESEALRKLGRAEESRASLSALYSRFPDSAYAAAARAKLDAAKSAP